MLRLVRALRAALFAVVVCGAVGACSSGPKMTKIEAPSEGITLSYDLATGQTYSGHVYRSEAVESRVSGSNITRSVAFDVSLVVVGPAEGGGNKVVATFTNIDLNWSLPEGLPVTVTETSLAFQGLEVDFHVASDGQVLYRPPMPDSISPYLASVLRGVLDMLETAFLTVPERPVQIGESWRDETKRGREGDLGGYMTRNVTTKVAGYFRNGAGEEIAKLESGDKERAVTTTKEGSREYRKKGKTTSLFSTSGSYLVSTKGEGEITELNNETIFVEFQVDWTKGERRAVVPAPQEVQSIVNPCDPDYVGEEECAPAGDTPPPPPLRHDSAQEKPVKAVMAQGIHTPDPDLMRLMHTKTGYSNKGSCTNKTAFCIDSSGRAVDVQTVQPCVKELNFRQNLKARRVSERSDPEIDKIIRETVETWRFKPFTRTSAPVGSLAKRRNTVCTTVQFDLNFGR